MATPIYNALVSRTRAWSNKPDANTISEEIIQDCLSYSADECYRLLRIPPLEYTTRYTVTDVDNSSVENTLSAPYENAYTTIDIPHDLTEFIYLRTVAQSSLGTPYSSFPAGMSIVFSEITDKRTFFDGYAEKYSRYNWMWSDDKIYIHPQLAVGTILEIQYYQRLGALDALYDVLPNNYSIGTQDAYQPYLTLGSSGDTPLYFSGVGANELCFSTLGEAQIHASPVTIKYFLGKEFPNWLRDQEEKVLIWGALYYLAGFLFDDKMEQRYQQRFTTQIDSLNEEEKFRRARGGNVQVNVNTGGLI